MDLKMYPVFGLRARHSFLVLTMLCAAVWGCSSSPSPVTVPIEQTALKSGDCQRLASAAKPSVVYSCKGDTGPVFVATLKDCSIPEKLSFQATTRQLLVGLTGMKVVKQEPVPVGSVNMLQSVVTGAIDADPVMMSTFTYRDKSCVNDIILWQGMQSAQEPSQATIAAFSESSRKIATSLLNDKSLVHDVTPTEG
jgi:hypothetical protein